MDFSRVSEMQLQELRCWLEIAHCGRTDALDALRVEQPDVSVQAWRAACWQSGRTLWGRSAELGLQVGRVGVERHHCPLSCYPQRHQSHSLRLLPPSAHAGDEVLAVYIDIPSVEAVIESRLNRAPAVNIGLCFNSSL
jgi:hypothetical protein